MFTLPIMAGSRPAAPSTFRPAAKTASSLKWRLLVGLCAASITPAASAQQYRFSEGPVTATWLVGVAWNGRHQFLDVYCLSFPNAHSVESTSEGLLNDNAISYFRAVYKGRVAAHVVTSTIPVGRSEADEFKNLLENERRYANAVNTTSSQPRYRVTTRKMASDQVIDVRMSNVVEESPDGVFPLTRPLLRDAEGPPNSRSSHRLFVHGSNRFEVAVIGVPNGSDGEDGNALEKRLAALADQLVASLQKCSITPSSKGSTD